MHSAASAPQAALPITRRSESISRSHPKIRFESAPVGDALSGDVTEHDPHVSNDLRSEAEVDEEA